MPKPSPRNEGKTNKLDPSRAGSRIKEGGQYSNTGGSSSPLTPDQHGGTGVKTPGRGNNEQPR